MPAITTTVNSIEQQPGWIQPGNVGDTGGGSSAAPTGTFLLTTGSVFSAKGAAPYNNGYFYKVIAGNFAASTLYTYGLDFMFPTAADLAASQGIEFEIQLNIGSKIYNMAWQADFLGSKLWRTFDYNLSDWEPTSIAIVPPVPGVFTSVQGKFLCDGAGNTTHLTFTVDGVEYPVNVTRPATAKVESNYLHAAFQLDSNGLTPPTPYSCHVQNITLTATPTSAE